MTHEIRHATCVNLDGQGVLFLGPSGSGKSACALQLIALGATLVADDQTELRKDGPDLWGHRPASLPPLIEARGVGLLNAPMSEPCKLALAVDLAQQERERIPPLRHVTILGTSLPLLHGVQSLHFVSAISIILRYGRQTP